MTVDPQTIVDRIVPHRQPAAQAADAFAPANIALCKYWGKREEALKLPLTGSLSVSLGELGTHMRISLSGSDRLSINSEDQPADSKAFIRLFAFLDLFRSPGTGFQVDSQNQIPMAAGLASSASAFAATVDALNLLYGWNLTDPQRSLLARLGSGSACRSIHPGFMEWRAGERADGMDSYAVPLDTRWPDFRVGILTLSSARKPVGSGEGMRRTRESSLLFQSWPAQVARDLPVIRQAVMEKNLPALGAAAEQNAMAMHATMIAAWPPILYWQPESVATLHRVQGLRSEGLEVYATMDAGPNVKLLFESISEADLRRAFPELEVVAPFAHSV